MAATTIKLLDVADTPEKQEQGLQFVKALEANTGLLFSFKHPRILSFWMKNTSIPLDIAFIDQEDKIVKIEHMVPYSYRSITSGRPCTKALEVEAGTFEQNGVVIGNKVTLDEKTVIISDADSEEKD